MCRDKLIIIIVKLLINDDLLASCANCLVNEFEMKLFLSNPSIIPYR